MLQTAVALVTTAWSWESYLDQQFALPRMLVLVLLFTCALLLLRGGRFDQRAKLLGAFCALGASSFAVGVPSILDLGLSRDRPVFLPEVFLPTVMWAFAREFPRVHRRTWVDDVARRMMPISAMVGGALWIVNATPLLERMQVVSRATNDGLHYWGILAILILSALVVLGLRARSAKADEARRAALFICGILVGVGPIFLNVLIEMFWPAARQFGDEHRNALGVVVFASILSIPVSTTYALLSRRAFDIRVAVRASYRRLLTRRVLTVVGAAPLAALVWLLASQPTRTVGEVLSEPLALMLAAAAGVAGLTAGVRRRLLIYLDAWVDPEAEDQRRVLAAASGTLAQATSSAQVEEVGRRRSTARERCAGDVVWLQAVNQTRRDTTSLRRMAGSRHSPAHRRSSMCSSRRASRSTSIPTTGRLRSSSCPLPMLTGYRPPLPQSSRLWPGRARRSTE